MGKAFGWCMESKTFSLILNYRGMIVGRFCNHTAPLNPSNILGMMEV